MTILHTGLMQCPRLQVCLVETDGAEDVRQSPTQPASHTARTQTAGHPPAYLANHPPSRPNTHPHVCRSTTKCLPRRPRRAAWRASPCQSPRRQLTMTYPTGRRRMRGEAPVPARQEARAAAAA
eukprot:25060-Chlamydomonas_euryale.AAC.1